MNPAIAPAIVAAKMMPNDNPAAKPAAGANKVLTEAVRNTEKIFQNIFIASIQKSCIFAPEKQATLAQLVEQRIRNA